MSYVVIRTGGKQYKVSEGENLQVERLEGEIGQEIELGDVLMLEHKGQVVLDRQTLERVKVRAKIVRHGRGRKVHTIKYRRRKGFQKKMGHRQDFTEIRIQSIGA